MIEGITRDGEVVPLSRDLGLRGRVLRVGWELPENLSEQEWRSAGELLGKVEHSVSWWLGDWWRAFKPEWGERAKLFSELWDGPAYTTCRNAGAVCDAFDIARRRADLSFAHHVEVASLSASAADELLAWAEETGASSRELRAEVNRRRVPLGSSVSSDTCTTADLFDLISAGVRFGCVYADPPWLYDNQGTRASTGNHYGGMSVEQLCELPIRELAADQAHIHLWTTNGFLFECPRIFAAWGFEFRSSFVWVKPQMGIGNYWRNSHEFLLTGIRGDAKRFNDHSLMSWLECERSNHSEKPEQVRAFLERASPAPCLELFGRRPANGWTVWGNQIERNLFMPQAAE